MPNLVLFDLCLDYSTSTRIALTRADQCGLGALRVVAGGVNKLLTPDNACVLVTHYQRLLNYITPDYVHVMSAGRIIKSGDKALALELESRGYDWLLDVKKAAA